MYVCFRVHRILTNNSMWAYKEVKLIEEVTMESIIAPFNIPR